MFLLLLLFFKHNKFEGRIEFLFREVSFSIASGLLLDAATLVKFYCPLLELQAKFFEIVVSVTKWISKVWGCRYLESPWRKMKFYHDNEFWRRKIGENLGYYELDFFFYKLKEKKKIQHQLFHSLFIFYISPKGFRQVIFSH